MTATPPDDSQHDPSLPDPEGDAETKRIDGLPLEADTERLDRLSADSPTERLDGLPSESVAGDAPTERLGAAPAPNTLPQTRRELREQDRAEVPPARRFAMTPTERFDAPLSPELPPEPAPAKRFPWPPVLIGLGAGALGALLVVGVLTLTGGIPAPVSTPSSAPPPAAATPTSAPPPAGQEQPAAQPEAPGAPAAPRPEAGPNECVDALGDGGVDLDTASVARDDGDLVTRFTVASELPSGDSGVGIIVASRNGQRAYQLGVALTAGEPDRIFVVNLANGDEQDLDTDDVSVDGSTITASFPDSVLRRMGNDWQWYAFATAQGAALDACPGTEDSPEWLVFSDRD